MLFALGVLLSLALFFLQENRLKRLSFDCLVALSGFYYRMFKLMIKNAEIWTEFDMAWNLDGSVCLCYLFFSSVLPMFFFCPSFFKLLQTAQKRSPEDPFFDA